MDFIRVLLKVICFQSQINRYFPISAEKRNGFNVEARTLYMDNARLTGPDQNIGDINTMIHVHAKATNKQLILAIGCAETEYCGAMRVPMTKVSKHI